MFSTELKNEDGVVLFTAVSLYKNDGVALCEQCLLGITSEAREAIQSDLSDSDWLDTLFANGHYAVDSVED